MKLTEAESMVLGIALNETWLIRSRNDFTAGRPGMPHTMGLREAFDALVERGLLAPVYRISSAGRTALEGRNQ